MGGDDNTVHLVTAAGVETWPTLSTRTRSRDASSSVSPTWSEARGRERSPFASSACRMRDGLPLPRYETAGAAGLDLVAAIADDAPVVLAALRRALVPTGLVLAACRRASRRRCGRAPASRSSTASPCSTRRARSTPTIAARCRCCSINLGRRAVRDHARHAHRAARRRAGHAGRRSSRSRRSTRTRRAGRRLRLDRAADEAEPDAMILLSRRSLLAIAAVVDIALHARPTPVAAKAPGGAAQPAAAPSRDRSCRRSCGTAS